MGNTASAPVVLAGEWLSMQETAERLGKSPKTIEAMVTANTIKSTLIPRAGRKPERVYEARDVQRLVDEAAKRVRPHAPVVAVAPKPLALSLPPELMQMIGGLAEMAREYRKPALKEKLWLSFEEAAAHSGLGAGYLRQQIEEGKIEAVKGGPHNALRIRRVSLEAFAG